MHVAHPRSRGENGRPEVAKGTLSGSSPLTRGKLFGSDLLVVGHRLIPAHAGKTAWPILRWLPSAAHPRSRGENEFSPPDWPFVSGSSPLTRGKRSPHSGGRRTRRLIPAHAGKTLHHGKARWPRPAHPRSRGENPEVRPMMVRDLGSSPLTRGKRRPRVPRAGGHGLIPAHAGKTRENRGEIGSAWAHPRSRGENALLAPGDGKDLGSSPLTRGKRQRQWPASRRPGLIPAHAGKTRSQQWTQCPPPAHPRSRGENEVAAVDTMPATGSSPLTRGKPGGTLGGAGGRRLIPAHAGKTLNPGN